MQIDLYDGCKAVIGCDVVQHTHTHARARAHARTHTHTHTHIKRPFVRDCPGEPVPERKNLSGFY